MKKYILLSLLLTTTLWVVGQEECIFCKSNILNNTASAIGIENINQGEYSLTIGTVNSIEKHLSNVSLSGIYNKADIMGFGNCSHTFGNYNTIQGDSSIIIGNHNLIDGVNSHLMGTSSTIHSDFSVGLGYNNLNTGIGSMIFGNFNEASNTYSTAIGMYAKSYGNAALAIGNYAEASGMFSMAIGNRVKADALWAMVIGGNQSGLLVNDNPFSLAIGFNSDIPTLFVDTSPGIGETGNVGIGNITMPTAKLHIKSDNNKDATLLLEPASSDDYGKLMVGDEEHYIQANSEAEDSDLIFHAKTNSDFYFENGRLFIAPGQHLKTDFITGIADGVKITNYDHKGLYVKQSGEIQLGDSEIEAKAKVQIEEAGSMYYRDHESPAVSFLHIGNNVYSDGLKNEQGKGTIKRIQDGFANSLMFYDDGNIEFRVFADGAEDEPIEWTPPALSISNTSNVSIGFPNNPEDAKLIIHQQNDAKPILHLLSEVSGTKGFLLQHKSGYNVFGVDVMRITTKYGSPLNPPNEERTAFYINSRGYVGMNTDTPSHELEVNGITQSTELHTTTIKSPSTEDVNIVGSNGEGIHIADNGIVSIENLSTTNLEIDGTLNANIDNIVFENLTVNNKLDVLNVLNAHDFYVKDMKGWKDEVFDNDYPLLSLKEVEAYIAIHHHLPDIPSESEVLENGISLGEMNALLMQKIEELTLYVIELEKKIENEK